MSYINLKNIILSIYALVQGFFLGMLFGIMIPFSWPFDVITGYALGLLAGGFIAFGLFGKWQTRAYVRYTTALLVLAVTAINSCTD